MICERVQIPGGGTGVVCSRGQQQHRCAICGGLATRRCDGPAPIGARRKTCDRWICDGCARHEEPDRDFCPECVHAREARPVPLLEDSVRPRGGPPRHLRELLPDGDAARAGLVLAEAYRGRPPPPYTPSSPPLPREPGCDDDEPAPTGPEDLGFSSPGTPGAMQRAEEGERHATGAGKAGPQEPQPDAGPAKPASAPHTPHRCKDCDAEIYWGAVLDENGQRKKRDDGRFSAMPVNAAPDPAGNVVLYRRPREGIVCRVLKKDEAPPPGAVLRTSHFSNCPRADERRQGRRRR